jgi:hypothetical protein
VKNEEELYLSSEAPPWHVAGQLYVMSWAYCSFAKISVFVYNMPPTHFQEMDRCEGFTIDSIDSESESNDNSDDSHTVSGIE